LQHKVNLGGLKRIVFLGGKITTLKNLGAKSVIKPCYYCYMDEIVDEDYEKDEEDINSLVLMSLCS